MAAKVSLSIAEPALLAWARQRADREGVSLPNGYCAAKSLNDARNDASVSTIGFVAGGALLAAGAALVLFAPSGSTGSVEVAPSAAERSGGLLLTGRFQ